MRALLLSFAVCLLATNVSAQKSESENGFVKLFDGESLKGWKLAEENPTAWHVEDGQLVCDGSRC
ncbi:MAG: DUF1080 domain-containing protein, partial [Planctomycetota bacterium]